MNASFRRPAILLNLPDLAEYPTLASMATDIPGNLYTGFSDIVVDLQTITVKC